ncbi:MAG TPA: aminotransferase class I/II-fold pyridoxal phosphate-dependent enzyme [Candidatus Atribacteria bacterium]|nr:aminotransferase class I/II-fold pyridoxal phosphate-dependent enzyme [Candidatus Atribacteria bacterium]
MDSTKYSLKDFYDIPGKDIMEKAAVFSEYSEDVKRRHHYQYRRVSLTGSGPTMEVIDTYTGKAREMIYMASNDYLNLTKHPRVIEAGKRALEKYGAGAGSVPLLGGTLDIHCELEKAVAEFKGCKDAIIYTSGFGSNCNTLLAMLGKSDIAILDQYVHASIVDGCSRTNVRFFRHNNLEALEKLLVKFENEYVTKLVVVDGVYSMDGDIAPLDRIVELAHSHGAYVMVDEAHATGVIGENGRGTPEHFHIEGKVDIVAGTFSKGLGAVGGFIAANPELIEYLRFYSRGYMFSTAMTPQVAGSLREGLKVIVDEPERRKRLWDNINYFRNNLKTLGFNLGNSQTAIFPLIIGDDMKVKEICRRLDEMDIYVNPVFYPAVSRNLARIRISLMSEHTREHLDKVLNALEYLGKEYDII